eukprot:gnl/TRDRNA2_/TRDRNA2_57239_c0_seq1.p1 gnl/TRDRNA2_/TRDRNA2_57239_c0~~gnl/TRDRNA2_/TRDRNA2_57239_c0_seq1.p1  ORF type:complete len:113 (-),score=13.69 gnl/TRDRNA2_/TRDRNA2_57239_c0_seq1:7-345(-)
MCDRHGCHGSLECMQQLEGLVGGVEWRGRDAEAMAACAESPKLKMTLEPPAKWEPEEKDASMSLSALLVLPPCYALQTSARGQQQIVYLRPCEARSGSDRKTAKTYAVASFL